MYMNGKLIHTSNITSDACYKYNIYLWNTVLCMVYSMYIKAEYHIVC